MVFSVCAYLSRYRRTYGRTRSKGRSLYGESLGNRIAPQLENEFRKKHKSQVGCSWRADETYVKIKGQWNYLYRAVDEEGNTVDFYLSRNRDKRAAEAFFKKVIVDNMLPEKVVIDKSGVNKAALDSLNLQLALLFMMTGILMPILVRQIK